MGGAFFPIICLLFSHLNYPILLTFVYFTGSKRKLQSPARVDKFVQTIL